MNIINCNESTLFNNNNNNHHLLFNDFNNLQKSNMNNIDILYKQNQFNNFQQKQENIYLKFNNYISENNGMENNTIKMDNSGINKINDLSKFNFDKKIIQTQNQFFDYINNLPMPLTSFLTTKNGIHKMENYLYMNENKYINILLKILNKEGISKLMKNKFGNYFMQEIIKRSNYDDVKLILTLIYDNLVEISENISGTYAIQTLLSKVNTFELRYLVIKSIENRELEMAFNSNATYVLQKIIEKVPDIERININEIIINNLLYLTINQDCIFIIEKFIDTITIKQNKLRIQNLLYLHCLNISNNQYGNYLIQYILKIWNNDDINNIQNIIIENANFLVQQRYSSNVIEKCFEIFDYQKRKQLIKNICLDGDILIVIKNQYGHYVLNKIIKYIDEDIKVEIEKILNNKMPEMNKKEKSKTKKFISIMKNIQLKKKEKNKK